jgi:hypothetical protein
MSVTNLKQCWSTIVIEWHGGRKEVQYTQREPQENVKCTYISSTCRTCNLTKSESVYVGLAAVQTCRVQLQLPCCLQEHLINRKLIYKHKLKYMARTNVNESHFNLIKPVNKLERTADLHEKKLRST